MKKFFLVISVCILCVSCGVKSEPEYKSKIKYNVAINLT